MIDAERDTFLRKQGITVLRFENKRVFEDVEGVVKEIKSWLAK